MTLTDLLSDGNSKEQEAKVSDEMYKYIRLLAEFANVVIPDDELPEVQIFSGAKTSALHVIGRYKAICLRKDQADLTYVKLEEASHFLREFLKPRQNWVMRRIYRFLGHTTSVDEFFGRLGVRIGNVLLNDSELERTCQEQKKYFDRWRENAELFMQNDMTGGYYRRRLADMLILCDKYRECIRNAKQEKPKTTVKKLQHIYDGIKKAAKKISKQLAINERIKEKIDYALNRLDNEIQGIKKGKIDYEDQNPTTYEERKKIILQEKPSLGYSLTRLQTRIQKEIDFVDHYEGYLAAEAIPANELGTLGDLYKWSDDKVWKTFILPVRQQLLKEI